ncbi:hypothetical protein EYF80_022179 [Liparis tanakae]|uniref:Uncharacterized protein n=1 Tax=Liparis tanakae TaxID=230148 RepID=A0A4Z2HPT4_9TELE|nr:hypothetical protein EYF80_022179 [Liparis tanakae]
MALARRGACILYEIWGAELCAVQNTTGLSGDPEQKAELGHSLHLLSQRERERERLASEDTMAGEEASTLMDDAHLQTNLCKLRKGFGWSSQGTPTLSRAGLGGAASEWGKRNLIGNQSFQGKNGVGLSVTIPWVLPAERGVQKRLYTGTVEAKGGLKEPDPEVVAKEKVRSQDRNPNGEEDRERDDDDAVAEARFPENNLLPPPPKMFPIRPPLRYLFNPHACPLYSPTEEFGFLEGVGCLRCHN